VRGTRVGAAENQRPPEWIAASKSGDRRQGPRAERAQGGTLKWTRWT
jgi:hypothetical protein